MDKFYTDIAKNRLHKCKRLKYVLLYSFYGCSNNFQNKIINKIGIPPLLRQRIFQADKAFQKNTGFLFVQIYIAPLLSHRCSPFHLHYIRQKKFYQCCKVLQKSKRNCEKQKCSKKFGVSISSIFQNRHKPQINPTELWG